MAKELGLPKLPKALKNSNTPEALATKAAYRQAHDAYCREKEERERGAVLPLLTASEEREQASKHAREKAEREERPREENAAAGPAEDTNALLERWSAAKKARDYTTSDKLREELRKHGIEPDPLWPSGKPASGGEENAAAAPTEDTNALLERWSLAKKARDYTTSDKLREELRKHGIEPDRSCVRPIGGGAQQSKRPRVDNGQPPKPQREPLTQSVVPPPPPPGGPPPAASPRGGPQGIPPPPPMQQGLAPPPPPPPPPGKGGGGGMKGGKGGGGGRGGGGGGRGRR